mgnify:CR=1 FL=1
MNAKEAFLAYQVDTDAQDQDDRKHCYKDEVQHESATCGQESTAIQLRKYHDKVVLVSEFKFLVGVF